MSSRPRLRARLLAFLIGLALTLSVVSAFAAGDDAAVRAAVRQIMNEDYPGSLGPARRKLQDQLNACSKKGCNGGTKAEVYVALGMVASQLGNAEEAKQNFKLALQANPNAKLPSSGLTPSIKSQWEEVAPKAAPPPPPPAAPPTKPASTPAPAAPAAPEPPAAAPSAGAGDTGDEPDETQGVLAAAVKLSREALAADQAGNLKQCIEKDKEALKKEEIPSTRLHLSSCESRDGKLVDALRDARRALEVGVAKKNQKVINAAMARVRTLLERMPHVTFDPPPGVTDLQVKFDDRPVPTEALRQKFSVDPGKHKVTAEGQVNGFNSVFDEEYDIKEKDLVTVRITLRPASSGLVTAGQLKCIADAKTQEDIEKCLPQNRKNLVIRLGGDLSGYTDTNAVAVYTPAFNASIVSPTAGWNAGGFFVLDAVSAASPDIVASASPPFTEYRYAGGLNGGYKPGLYGINANASTSTSPDYVSYTAGGRLTADLNDKLITPTIGYTFSYDRVGRGPNNYLDQFNPLKGTLLTHAFEAGVTFVMSPTSVLLVGGSLTLERGDGSQPYRYIAMFDPVNVAPFVPNGATIDLVNRTRLPVKPMEQLPTARDRIAIGGRYNKRVGSNATFRIEQRFYFDTWGLKASSTDSRYMVDLSRHLRVWPHARLHAQTSANFYQLAYSADLAPEGGIILPTYRTGDRELASLVTATGGGGVRLALGEPEGEVKYGISLVGDVMYTKFLKALYVTTRTAVYGAVSFDVEF